MFSTGCGLRERKVKAIANGVVGGIGGVQANFAAEADSICREIPNGKTELVPPMDKSCARGCRCAGTKNENGEIDNDPRSTYDCGLWAAPEWQLIRFAGAYTLDGAAAEVVYVHHQARWNVTGDGCQLDFTVHGDLDEDGVYSTYEASVKVTPAGPLGTWPEKSILWE